MVNQANNLEEQKGPVKKPPQRSRNGCHECKRLKMKCDELKPSCGRCKRLNVECDYSIVLSWGGTRRGRKKASSKIGANSSSFIMDTDPMPQSSKPSVTDKKTKPIEKKLELTLASKTSSSISRSSLSSSPSSMSSSSSSSSNSPPVNSTVTIRSSLPNELSAKPEMLRKNNNYNQLFDHFVAFVPELLVPLEFDDGNPLRTTVPAIALSAPHLMTLLMAYSVSHRARALNEPEPASLVSDLMGNTLKGLSDSMRDPNLIANDATLTTVLLLVPYNMVAAATANESWKLHMKGAKELIKRRKLIEAYSKMEKILPGDATVFLVQSFAYFDTISALCAPAKYMDLPLDYKEMEYSKMLSPPLGIDSFRVPLFSRVAHLIKSQTYNREEVSILIGKLTRFLSLTDLTEPTIINVVYTYSVLLCLYRRVLKVATSSAEVQDLVVSATKVIENHVFPPGSELERSLVFPFFIIGCEAIDDRTRHAYKSRLEWLSQDNVGQIATALDIMQTTWLEGRSWEDIVEERECDLLLI